MRLPDALSRYQPSSSLPVREFGTKTTLYPLPPSPCEVCCREYLVLCLGTTPSSPSLCEGLVLRLPDASSQYQTPFPPPCTIPSSSSWYQTDPPPPSLYEGLVPRLPGASYRNETSCSHMAPKPDIIFKAVEKSCQVN